jgi:predicted anti-sigma-YlaC factor YlaD
MIGTAKEMPCRELVELVTDYLDESLSRRDRKRFEAHIAGCPLCRLYMEQMRTTIRTMGRLTEDSLSPEMLSELQHVFRDWRAA